MELALGSVIEACFEGARADLTDRRTRRLLRNRALAVRRLAGNAMPRLRL
jgi:hypothetical protein